MRITFDYQNENIEISVFIYPKINIREEKYERIKEEVSRKGYQVLKEYVQMFDGRESTFFYCAAKVLSAAAKEEIEKRLEVYVKDIHAVEVTAPLPVSAEGFLACIRGYQ